MEHCLKFHYLAHLALQCRYLHCKAGSTYLDEDIMGRIKTLARKSYCGNLAKCPRVIVVKYMRGCFVRWQAGECLRCLGIWTMCMGPKKGIMNALVRITSQCQNWIIDLGYCSDLGPMHCISGQPCRVYVHHVVGMFLVPCAKTDTETSCRT